MAAPGDWRASWTSATPGQGLKRTTGGAWLATIDNLVRALSTPGFWVQLAWDGFRQELMWAPWSEREPGWRVVTDAQLVAGRVELERAGFKPVGRELFRDAAELAAQRTLLDSAREWLERLESWDRTPRVGSWLSTYCGAEDSPYCQSIGRYVWTAAAGRVLEPGVQADMVPILVGAQGVGKTRGVEAMAPFDGAYVNVDLAVRDADLSRRLRGRLIVELAELRGLHTRDRTAINDFITSRTDTWVPKYKEFALSAPRRFIALGTTNDDEFLDDETGNRRWLPVRVGVTKAVDVDLLRRDRAQLWAEGAARFLIGGVDWEAAQRLAVAEHDQYRLDDALESDLATWLARPCAADAEHGGLNGVQSDAALVANGAAPFTLRDALIGVGTDPRTANRAMQLRVGKALRALGYEKRMQRDPNGNGWRKIWTRVPSMGHIRP